MPGSTRQIAEARLAAVQSHLSGLLARPRITKQGMATKDWLLPVEELPMRLIQLDWVKDMLANGFVPTITTSTAANRASSLPSDNLVRTIGSASLTPRAMQIDLVCRVLVLAISCSEHQRLDTKISTVFIFTRSSKGLIIIKGLAWSHALCAHRVCWCLQLTAYLEAGLLEGIASLYNAETRTFSVVYALGEKVCGFHSVVHGGTIYELCQPAIHSLLMTACGQYANPRPATFERAVFAADNPLSIAHVYLSQQEICLCK